MAASSGIVPQENRPEVITTLRRLQEWLVLGVAGIYSAGYAAVGLALLVVPVAGEALASRRVPWRRGPLDVYLLAFTLAMIVSGLVSSYRGVATGSALLMALTIYLAYGVPYRILTGAGQFLHPLLRVWFTGGVGAALVAFVLLLITGGSQAAVPALGPNAVGSTTAITLMFGLGLVLLTRTRMRYVVAAGMVLIALVLALTLSRGAWIGAGTGMVVFFILIWHRHPRAVDASTARRGRAWPLLALVAGIVVALTLAGGSAGVLRKKVVSIPNLFKNRERVYLARSALAIAADHPLVGSGLNTFTLLHPHPSVAADAPRRKPKSGPPSFAHNIFLNMAAEGGILGLGAFLALLGRGATASWRWTRAAAGSERITSAAVCAAFVALLVHQQFDGTVLSVHLSVGLWFLLAIMASREPRRPE